MSVAFLGTKGKIVYRGDQLMSSVNISTAKQLKEEFKFYGICVNCDHKNDCTYRQNPERPILFCEQYEVSTPPAKIMSVKRQKPQSETTPETFKGLCQNCERRFTCMYPKPEGGVWHCEEYL
jgi:hypothetical protein